VSTEREGIVVPDAELVVRAKDGDLKAMDVLIERHHESVYRMCLSILREVDRAEDAVQETFIKAYKGLARFRGDAQFKTWLMTIAGNEAKAALRKSGRRREQTLDDSPELHSGDPDIEEQTAMRDDATRMRRMVAVLPEKQRLAVTLRVDEGLSFKEIGEIIESSEGAARVNYHHGIRRLREMATV
jgi:RNA polymerase sigma-70 factor (ECF subfamily)